MAGKNRRYDGGRVTGNTGRGQGNVNRRENEIDANFEREDQNQMIIERLEMNEALRDSGKIRRDDNTNRRQQKKYPHWREERR